MTDEGLFFSWGNVEGHAMGDDYVFSESVYNTTPGASIETDLSLEQDAAKAYQGDPWRMPSVDEFRELVDNCTTVWTTLDGVDGILFTSNLNGNTLFFPATGYYNGTSLVIRGVYGLLWSSKYYSATDANRLLFNSSGQVLVGHLVRFYGLPVRAVLQPT